MKVKLIISLALAIIAFTFIAQNTETVRVVFLAWSIEMSIVLLVFIILGVGIIIGWLMNSSLRFVRNRKQTKHQRAMQTQGQDAQAKATASGEKEQHG